jgi:tRNA A-37 threonylcarbamoyl transferase component Bud32
MSTQDPDDTWLDAASEPAEGPEGDHAGLRYEDRGRIAHGASGEVRRVFDHRLGCTVVMKVMWARLVDAVVLRDRFWREATTTARLQHPAIVPVHDRGELADGRPYFTMAEVRGDTYDVVVRHAQGRDIRRLATLLARACEGVGYAHSLGVVHRDLKPANLMIGPFGEVLVMDWGIARDLNDAEDARVLELPGEEIYATRHGAILGTPAYMSPEQARAEHDLVDRRSDVFAVGAVLYRALTGRRHVHGTPQEVLEDLAQGRLSLFEHGGADVPDQLREITLNAMALDPDARFADAGEMAHALQDWLDGARRRERALAIVGSAAPIRAKATRLRRQADALPAGSLDATRIRRLGHSLGTVGVNVSLAGRPDDWESAFLSGPGAWFALSFLETGLVDSGGGLFDTLTDLLGVTIDPAEGVGAVIAAGLDISDPDARARMDRMHPVVGLFTWVTEPSDPALLGRDAAVPSTLLMGIDDRQIPNAGTEGLAAVHPQADLVPCDYDFDDDPHYCLYKDSDGRAALRAWLEAP